MICSEFRELLDRYESIDELDRECMDAHCDFCDECRSEMEFFKSITNISASIPCPAPPKTLIAEVNAKLDKMAVAPVGGKAKSWSIKQYATLAACLAVGIAVGINGSYIKDRLTDNADDGVISETISAVENMPQNEETADVKVEDNTPATSSKEQVPETNSDKKNIAPVVTETVTTRPAVTPEANKPQNTPATQVATTEPVTQTEPETTPSVNDYAVVGEGRAVAYYSVGSPNSSSKGAITDYILIADKDMAAVFGIMSEMGVASYDGYYMTTRTNFYQMLDKFDAKGIEYDYQLIYSAGEEIVFKLRYSVMR